jgi:uncharacterized membrane protein YgcG
MLITLAAIETAMPIVAMVACAASGSTRLRITGGGGGGGGGGGDGGGGGAAVGGGRVGGSSLTSENIVIVAPLEPDRDPVTRY